MAYLNQSPGTVYPGGLDLDPELVYSAMSDLDQQRPNS